MTAKAENRSSFVLFLQQVIMVNLRIIPMVIQIFGIEDFDLEWL